MCWFQHRDVKNWVNGLKAVWELECDGMAARSCKDFVQPEELIQEFLGWSGSAEVLSLDKNLTADFEIWGR